MNTIFRSDTKTLCMGILNVTPDSFSDGGKFTDVDVAVSHALKMRDDGADIIDIGGESTKPGYLPISVDEEISRVIPVIKRLSQYEDLTLSIDTMKSEVAKEALLSGCKIVNDISGFAFDSKMASTISSYNASAIIVFNYFYTAKKNDVSNLDIIDIALMGLSSSIEMATQAGISADKISIDPGIGFGTTRQQELTLIRRLSELSFNNKYPILLACSRKRIVRELMGTQLDSNNIDLASISLGLAGVKNGASMLRVHDVKNTVVALKGFDAALGRKG